MAEKITLLDIFGSRVQQKELPKTRWINFDTMGMEVEGRVLYVNVKWDEERNRRRATVILETEEGERVGISGSWTTFVRLIQKANLKKDDRIKIRYLGTLAQVEVVDAEYAKAFKEAYESYMEFLRRRGRNIRFTKPPAGTKLFELDVLYRAPEPEPETKPVDEETKEVIKQL